MDETLRDELRYRILATLYREAGADWMESLRVRASEEARRLNGDEWDALEVLMLLRQMDHVEAPRDYGRGRLTASGLWLARQMAES